MGQETAHGYSLHKWPLETKQFRYNMSNQNIHHQFLFFFVCLFVCLFLLVFRFFFMISSKLIKTKYLESKLISKNGKYLVIG